MATRWSRRSWLKQVGLIGVAAASPVFPGGCGGGSDGGDDPPDSVELPYSENDEFNAKFTEAIKRGQQVIVTFDGSTKITKDSEFFAMLQADENLVNRNEFVEQLHNLDTEEGRKSLAAAFDDELLKHEQVSNAHKLPSGEIIEPLTFALVVVCVLIVAGTILIALKLGRPTEVVVEVDLATGELRMVFRPVSA